MHLLYQLLWSLLISTEEMQVAD